MFNLPFLHTRVKGPKGNGLLIDKKLIHLIIGLGNPGEKYRNTYHNVGFLFIDSIVENYEEIGRAHV